MGSTKRLVVQLAHLTALPPRPCPHAPPPDPLRTPSGAPPDPLRASSNVGRTHQARVAAFLPYNKASLLTMRGVRVVARR
eukprot:490883-Prorocentrum_minimum.AAC.1